MGISPHVVLCPYPLFSRALEQRPARYIGAMETPTRGSRMTLALLDGLIFDEGPFGEPPIDGTRRYCRYSSRPAATKAHSYRGMLGEIQRTPSAALPLEDDLQCPVAVGRVTRPRTRLAVFSMDGRAPQLWGDCQPSSFPFPCQFPGTEMSP